MTYMHIYIYINVFLLLDYLSLPGGGVPIRSPAARAPEVEHGKANASSLQIQLANGPRMSLCRQEQDRTTAKLVSCEADRGVTS